MTCSAVECRRLLSQNILFLVLTFYCTFYNYQFFQVLLLAKNTASNKLHVSFIFCLGHLVGNNSIIEILKSKGFKPRHILATDSLQR